jgi:uncharacterized membrane protein YjfL (UPF0719 family)
MLFQPLPPLPGSQGVDWVNVGLNMLLAVVWAIVASIGFAGAIAIGLRIFSLLTPGINEWEEIKKGNLSVALLWAAFILAVAAVVIAVLLK